MKPSKDKGLGITLSGNVLTIKNTLIELNDYLNTVDLKENYYVERIGYKSITTI